MRAWVSVCLCAPLFGYPVVYDAWPHGAREHTMVIAMPKSLETYWRLCSIMTSISTTITPLFLTNHRTTLCFVLPFVLLCSRWYPTNDVCECLSESLSHISALCAPGLVHIASELSVHLPLATTHHFIVSPMCFSCRNQHVHLQLQIHTHTIQHKIAATLVRLTHPIVLCMGTRTHHHIHICKPFEPHPCKAGQEVVNQCVVQRVGGTKTLLTGLMV